MRPSRTTVADTGDGSWPLDARQMREAVAVFDDPAYDDWQDLFPLQDAAVSRVEAVLGAPICPKRIVDYYACAPPSRRLHLSARPIGAWPLADAQFVSPQVVASLPARESTLAATLDLGGDAPSMVLSAPVPSLGDAADPLRVQYEFAPETPQFVVDAVAVAFRGAFDARYRGALPLDSAQIEAALNGEAMPLGPYD